MFTRLSYRMLTFAELTAIGARREDGVRFMEQTGVAEELVISDNLASIVQERAERTKAANIAEKQEVYPTALVGLAALVGRRKSTGAPKPKTARRKREAAAGGKKRSVALEADSGRVLDCESSGSELDSDEGGRALRELRRQCREEEGDDPRKRRKRGGEQSGTEE